MPKAKQRLTKAIVLNEVKELRNKITNYFGMSTIQLRKEFAAVFPKDKANGLSVHLNGGPSREYMIERLVMAATYYLTLVLDVE